jgi:hypothetical protein
LRFIGKRAHVELPGADIYASYKQQINKTFQSIKVYVEPENRNVSSAEIQKRKNKRNGDIKSLNLRIKKKGVFRGLSSSCRTEPGTGNI